MKNDKLFEEILDKTHEAVITIDQDHIIVKCNKKLLNLLWPNQEDPVGKPIESVLPGIDCDKEISNYEYKPLTTARKKSGLANILIQME